LAQFDSPFQIMVLLDVTTGLRRSELFALKWSDVDFWNLTIDINRSIFQGVIGNCKTEASGRPVPLSLDVAADLWLWKERTLYSKPDDWIFASPWAKGSMPLSLLEMPFGASTIRRAHSFSSYDAGVSFPSTFCKCVDLGAVNSIAGCNGQGYTHVRRV
jgi:integrase